MPPHCGLCVLEAQHDELLVSLLAAGDGDQ